MIFNGYLHIGRSFSIVLNGDHADILSKDKKIVARGIKQGNNLIRLLFKLKEKTTAHYASSASLETWHKRLGHVNCNTLNKMIANGSITGMNLSDKKAFFCEDCPLGKQARFPFTSKTRSEVIPGEVVHADLCGPMQTPVVDRWSKIFSIT